MNAPGLFTHRALVNTWEGAGACDCPGDLVIRYTAYDAGLKCAGREPVVGHADCPRCDEHLEIRPTGLERYPAGGRKPTR